MGKKKRRRQKDLWVATSEIPVPPGHPFYEALEELLKEHRFDDFVEQRCTKFYAGPAGAFEQDVAFSSAVFRRRNILRANACSNAAAPRAGSVGRRFMPPRTASSIL